MENLIILKVLEKDIDKRIEFFNCEFHHIKKISNFFCKGNSNIHETSIRAAFYNLEAILNYVEENLKIVKDKHKEIKSSIHNLEDTIKNIKHPQKRKQILDTNLFSFFNNYTIIKYELDRLTENFNFLQRKIINIVNSFPFYYPTPKISSYREASKIHFFLEWISKEFLETLNEKIFKSEITKDLRFTANFYWNYEKEIKFVPKITNKSEREILLNFIINSDSYLPYRRSHYILILHECIHFYLDYLNNQYKRLSFEESYQRIEKDEFEKIFPKYFVSLKSYIEGTISVLDDIGLRKSLSQNDILDIFIDSILTEVFGMDYYLPLLSHIFLYDEDLFLNPNFSKIWMLRAIIPLKVTSLKKDKDKILKINIENLLDKFENIQLKHLPRVENIYIRQKSIESILLSYVGTYVEKYVKNNKKFKELAKQQKRWLKVLLDYQREYIEDILTHYYERGEKNFYEGRTLAVNLYNTLLKTKRKYKLKNVPDQDLKIFSFKYIKARANCKFGELLSTYINGNVDNYLFNYGSYSFLQITDESEKGCRENQEENQENQIVYYTNNYELTLYEGNLEDFQKDISKDEVKNRIFVNIKLLLNRELDSSYENFKEGLRKNLEEIKRVFPNLEIEPYYFISFDWFDIFLSLVFKLKDEKYANQKINLTDLLSEIKGKVISKNRNIYKSETEVFIGSNFVKECILEIKDPRFQIRLSSGYDPSIFDKMKNIFQENNNINYLYGIRDVEIEYTNTKDLKKVLIDCISLLRESNDNISDIQFVPITPYIRKDNNKI